MRDWSTRSLKFWSESSSLETTRFWSTFTLAMCVCSWVVLLLVFRCITRLILVSYYTVLQYRILSVSCVHSIPAVLHYLQLFALFISGHSFFEQFEFCLWIDMKIKYLHLAFDSDSVHTSLHTLCRRLEVSGFEWSDLF